MVSIQPVTKPRTTKNLLPKGRVEGDGRGRDCCAVSKLRLGKLGHSRCNLLKRLRWLKSTRSVSSARDVGRDMMGDAVNRRSARYRMQEKRLEVSHRQKTDRQMDTVTDGKPNKSASRDCPGIFWGNCAERHRRRSRAKGPHGATGNQPAQPSVPR